MWSEVDHQLWLVLDRLKPLIVLGGISAPLIFGALRRRLSVKRPWIARSSVVFDLGIAFVLGPTVFFFAFCSPPSGLGVVAETWYRRTQPLIMALDYYRHERRTYPDSLSVLVPRYVERPFTRAP